MSKKPQTAVPQEPTDLEEGQDRIICLFTETNDYNQPTHVLRAWWRRRPRFEQVLAALPGGNMRDEGAILTAAAVTDGRSRRWNDVDYWLESVPEGKLLP